MQEVIPVGRSKPYSSISVKLVEIDSLCKGRDAQRCTVGVDVAKAEFFVAVHWPDMSFEKPWKVASPGGIGLLVAKLKELNVICPVTVAMESSGTYGDALRQALSDARIAVVRVSSKAVKDQSEGFDGVPSQHDGKDAAVIADLASRNKCRRWDHEPAGEDDQELRYWVRRLDSSQRIKQVYSGKLEALLARHWPEADRLISGSGATMIRALLHWGDPRELGADPQAAAQLSQMGGPWLKAEKIAKLIESARGTSGVRMGVWEKQEIQDLARQIRAERKQIACCRRRLEELGEKHEVIQLQKPALGVVTACVLWTCLGDPRDYSSAGAYRKAMGLNLIEHSSGTWKGQLRLSKRGQRQSRKWMYFSALRWMRSPEVKRWATAKRARDGGKGSRAVTGVMRKLSLAAWHIAQGQVFDRARLFPGRPHHVAGKTLGRR
jgi:transposase